MITPSMITVRTYGNVAEAGFAQSLLESQGIRAFLHGENAYTLGGYVSGLDGLRLQVPASQVEEAKRILDGEETAPLPDDFVLPPARDSDETEHPKP